MSFSTIGLSPSAFTVAFPFHMAWSDHFELIQIGKGLGKICPELELGKRVDDYFRFKSPRMSFTRGEILEQLKSTFILEPTHPPEFLLRGQIIFEKQEEAFLFIGSPILHSFDQIADMNLTFQDFAIHDAIGETIFMLQAKDAALADTKKMYSELLNAKNELNKINENLEDTIKNRTQELHYQKAYLENILYSMKDTLIVVSPDATIKTVNQATLDLLGYEEEELIGKSLRILLEEEQEVFQKTVLEVLVKGESVSGSERMYLAKDGSKIPVLFSGSAMRNKDDEIQGIVCVAQDLTERKKVEGELKESETRFKTLSELAPVGIYMTDLQGKCQYVNQRWSEMAGFSLDKAKGDGWIKGIHSEDRELVLSSWEQMIDSNGHWGTEYRFQDLDGQITVVYGLAKKIMDSSGNNLGYIGVNLDITERKHAEQERLQLETQLRQAQKMEALGTLAGGIAHDFNNILQGIFSSVETASLKLPKNNPAKDLLQQVLILGERGAALVRQILTFSRQDQQKQEIFQISPLVQEALQMMKEVLPSPIKIQSDIENVHGNILGISSQIHQVIINLCTNAGYAMGKNEGVLKISLHETVLNPTDAKLLDLTEGPYIKLSVQDTGSGIPPEIKKRIFDPFFTTKPVGEGSGMGLSVVHGIVKNHQGSITVESESGNGGLFQGTTFHVFLPVAEDDVSQPSSEEKLISQGEGHILLVDDEKIIIETTKEFLEHLGYTTSITYSSYAALELFRSNAHQFDLVLTDLTMPEMTGIQLSKELLRIRDDIPIILATGHSEILENLDEIGIRRKIQKPYSIEELDQVIQEVLNKPHDNPSK